MRTLYAYKLLNQTVDYHNRLISDMILSRKEEIALYFYYSILNLVRGYYENNYISYYCYRYFRNRIIKNKKGAYAPFLLFCKCYCWKVICHI